MEEILIILGQFVLEVVVISILDLVVYLWLAFYDAIRAKPHVWHPLLAWLGIVVLGAVLGLLSLLVLPAHFVHRVSLEVANLILAPAAVGLLMVLLGRHRKKRGRRPLRITLFAFGYSLAFSFALVRFLCI